jgi:predicted PurR-regulated permease PerM
LALLGWPRCRGRFWWDVLAFYASIHFVESNLINPLVQAEAVELPPVLTLFAALVFGLLLGPIGVLLAAPLAVVLLIAVNALYIEGMLGERRVLVIRLATRG